MARRRKISGYVVVETCDDYEQILCLETEYENGPPGGVLDWHGHASGHRTVFPSRKAARDAIDRTHHWAKAFGAENMPKREFCKILPVSIVGAR